MKESVHMSTPLTLDLMQTCAHMPFTDIAHSTNIDCLLIKVKAYPLPLARLCPRKGPQKGRPQPTKAMVRVTIRVRVKAGRQYVVLDFLSVHLYAILNFLNQNLYVFMDIFECPPTCPDLSLTLTSGAAAALMYIFGYPGEPIVEDNLHTRWFWKEAAIQVIKKALKAASGLHTAEV
jgi:hypothetical protein